MLRKHTDLELLPKEKIGRNLFYMQMHLFFPALEDFGITAIEALASGTINSVQGRRSLNFVKEGITGEFFEEQSSESLELALAKFDKSKYDKKSL